MKKTVLAALIGCTAISMPVGAQQSDLSEFDNAIYINKVEATPGQQVTLSVCLKNTVPTEGFQFNLSLPEGMTFDSATDGSIVTLSEERGAADALNLYTSLHANGSLSVLAGSTIGRALTGNDGEVCTIIATVNPAMALGNYQLVLRNLAISDDKALSYNTQEVVCPVSINDPSGISATMSHELRAVNSYDLQGRQLSDGRLAKGIYIRNGQKVIKK